MTAYNDARVGWLEEHRDDWFCLAQLLVTTVDHEVKSAPRTIRGVQLSPHERQLLASFQAHMRAELAAEETR